MTQPSEIPEWAMEQARDVLPCHCEECWTSRGLHDPSCATDYATDVAAALLAAYQRGREDAAKVAAECADHFEEVARAADLDAADEDTMPGTDTALLWGRADGASRCARAIREGGK